jgi:iron uptake system component EfeO
VARFAPWHHDTVADADEAVPLDRPAPRHRVPGRWVAPTAFAAAALIAVGAAGYLFPGRAPSPAPSASLSAPITTIGRLPSTSVRAGTGGCATPARAPQAGDQVFAVTNTSSLPLEITLIAPGGGVHGEIEGLGQGTTRIMHVRLGSGGYRFRCYFTEVPAIDGAEFTVTGPTPGSDAPTPVSTQDLTPVTLAYQHWISGDLTELQRRVRALAAAPDTAGQRAAWLSAHHLFETLGAAYDAFGDWGRTINGDDSGFHLVEASLWAPQPSIPTAAEQQLITAVDGLTAAFPSIGVDPLQIGLRAHEIVENTIEFTLTGSDDHGSHASLDTARANLEGTSELLDRLTPLLRTRYPELPQTQDALAHAERVVDDLARRYPDRPLGDYTGTDRAQLNTAFGGLVERLAPIAAITDIRRTN